MQQAKRGFFITLEGLEGSGKTTLVPPLVEYLREMGLIVCPTREPGGTSIGEQIREVVHSLKNTEIHPRTETLLYLGSRAQIVEELIRPRLNAGEIVICDRFFDTTVAYQGFGRGQDLKIVNHLINYATDGLTPDLTILFDVDPEAGRSRKRQGSEWNRMDAQSIEFYNRARLGYLKMAEVDARWVTIDATKGLEEVKDDLIREVVNRLWFVGLVENHIRKIER